MISCRKASCLSAGWRSLSRQVAVKLVKVKQGGKLSSSITNLITPALRKITFKILGACQEMTAGKPILCVEWMGQPLHTKMQRE